jgi:hypothetical protein
LIQVVEQFRRAWMSADWHTVEGSGEEVFSKPLLEGITLEGGEASVHAEIGHSAGELQTVTGRTVG